MVLSTLAVAAVAADVRPLVDVPMPYARGAVLVDRVKINGRGDYTFLLDTGSTSCTVTPAVAEELGLRKLGWSTVAAIGATKRLRVARVDTISLGAVSVKNPLTLIAEDNGLSRHVGRKVHGVLGTPFLWKWPVEFDFPKQRFRIYPTEFDLRLQPVEAPWSGVGNLSLRDRAAFIKVALNGGPAREMMLDTGATGLVLHKARAVEAKAYSPEWESTSLGSLGPARKSTYWQIDTLRVAGLTVEGAQAFTPHEFGDWRTDQLGNDALDPFRVLVDTGRGLMRLDRDEVPERVDGYPWGVGLSVRRDMDAVRVVSVWPDSHAAKHGIAPGDILISVNDSPVMELTDASLRQMLNRPRNQQVTVEIRAPEGNTRSLALTSQRYARKRPAPADESLATNLSVVHPDGAK